MKLNEVTTSRSQTILTEGWSELTESQHRYLGRFERELWPLMEELKTVFEADLTAKQITDIFTGAEASAVASGNNRTALGKAGDIAKLPVDIMKKVDAKINELGKMAAEAGPIKNADAKFEELKKKIGSSDSKVAAGIKKVSDWAKANPGKASLAVGILTAVAAFAAGPAGGAAAGFLLRSTTGLLKGEKLSTAVGKSIKTAAYGALAGAAFKFLSQDILDNFMTSSQEEWLANKEAMEAANAAAAKADVAKDFGFDSVSDMNAQFNGAIDYQVTGNYNGFFYNYDVTIAPEYVEEFKALNAAMNNAESFSAADYKATAEFHSFMKGMVNNEQNKLVGSVIDALRDVPKDSLNMSQVTDLLAQDQSLNDLYDSLEGSSKVMASALQGAAQTIDDKAQKATTVKPADKEELEKVKQEAEAEKESVAYDYDTQFNEYLEEGPMDAIKKAAGAVKGAAGKAAGAVGGAVKKGISNVKTGASNLANKVTLDKLMKTWKKMGEPKDTGSVVNILAGAGLTNDQITAIGSEQKVKLPKPTQPEPPADAPADATADADATAEPGDEDPKAPTPGGATAKPGAEPTNTDAVAKGVDADKDGKDDKTGNVIQMPGTTPADGVGAPKSGIAKGAAGAKGATGATGAAGASAPAGDKSIKVTGVPGQGSGGSTTSTTGTKPGATAKPKAGATAGAGAKVDIPTLAKQISDAGIGAEIKGQLTGKGGGSDLGSGMQIDIPTLASKISDAGMQQQIKQQLSQKQTA